jgi:hypothetical protein
MVLSLSPAADCVIAGLRRATNRAGRGFLGPSQTYLRRVLKNFCKFVESKKLLSAQGIRYQSLTKHAKQTGSSNAKAM